MWKTLKYILSCSAVMYFLNNLYIPLNHYDAVIFKYDQRIADSCKTNELIRNYHGDNSIKTYRYLKAASLMTSRYLDFQAYASSLEGKINYGLAAKKGDCVTYSLFTYTNFLYLVKNTDNSGLINNVRVTSGFVQDRSDKMYHPHHWIEYKFDDHWDVFETTGNDKGSIDSIYKQEISNEKSMTKMDSSIINCGIAHDYYPLLHYWIDQNDSLNKILVWKNILTNVKNISIRYLVP